MSLFREVVARIRKRMQNSELAEPSLDTALHSTLNPIR